MDLFPGNNITIGLLLPYRAAYGYGDFYSAGKYSASAITVALDRINKDPNLLTSHHINIVWKDTKCKEEMSISQMTEFLEQKVDAFIGFACTCTTQARIAASLNKMVISPVSVSIIKPKRSETFLRICILLSNMADSDHHVAREYSPDPLIHVANVYVAKQL